MTGAGILPGMATIPTTTTPRPDVPGRGAWRWPGGLLPLRVTSTSRVGYYRAAQPGEVPIGSAYARRTDVTFSAYAVHHGVRAIQRLAGMPPSDVDGWFGPRTAAAAESAQTRLGVTIDGIIGPATMHALLAPVVTDQAVVHQVPVSILGGIFAHESALDPAAVGVNGWDTGLAQINRSSTAHPEISAADALDPWFTVAWTAEQLRGRYDQWDGHTEADPWDIAVAFHHSPKLAGQWARDGIPPVVDGRVIQIEDYVIRVRTTWPTNG